MSAHQHYIKNAVVKALPTLRHDLDESVANTDELLEPVLLDIRELTSNYDHQPVVVRRVYLETSDSSSLASVGWVINEGLSFCLDCLKEFSLFTRKHHCRACGLLVCAECSSRFATLCDYDELGPQRVCNKCNPKVSQI